MSAQRLLAGLILILPILLAVVVGVATAYQPGVNARLAQHMPARVYGGIANFAVGLAVMLLVTSLFVITGTRLPDPARAAQAPWWAWCGGLLGAFFVTMSLTMVPITGAAVWLSGVVAGQLLGSLIIDHFGHLGLPVREITPGRVLGVILIMGGVACVRWL